MASAWGGAWGSAWGVSWGSRAPVVDTPPPIAVYMGGIQGPSSSDVRHAMLARDDREIVTIIAHFLDAIDEI